ncbi:hypothetical protein HK102_012668, partial [Quaeritorhiza haematococci]
MSTATPPTAKESESIERLILCLIQLGANVNPQWTAKVHPILARPQPRTRPPPPYRDLATAIRVIAPPWYAAGGNGTGEGGSSSSASGHGGSSGGSEGPGMQQGVSEASANSTSVTSSPNLTRRHAPDQQQQQLQPAFFSPLARSCYLGLATSVRHLLSAGARFMTPDGRDEVTLAVRGGHLRVVEVLNEIAGEDAMHLYEGPPLWLACQLDDIEMVRTLCRLQLRNSPSESESVPDKTMQENLDRALDIAVRLSHLNIVRTLLEFGADARVEDDRALCGAMYRGD